MCVRENQGINTLKGQKTWKKRPPKSSNWSYMNFRAKNMLHCKCWFLARKFKSLYFIRSIFYQKLNFRAKSNQYCIDFWRKNSNIFKNLQFQAKFVIFLIVFSVIQSESGNNFCQQICWQSLTKWTQSVWPSQQ